MVQKICPVCDQVMKSAHYCKNCRRWVRHPYERDVNYYLNERKQDNESDNGHRVMTAAVGWSPQTSVRETERKRKRSGIDWVTILAALVIVAGIGVLKLSMDLAYRLPLAFSGDRWEYGGQWDYGDEWDYSDDWDYGDEWDYDDDWWFGIPWDYDGDWDYDDWDADNGYQEL